MANQVAMLPVQGLRDRLQYYLLDGGRALMLLGAAAAVSTVGNPDTDATQAFFGLLTWLIGVWLISLFAAQVAGRFPEAAALGAAAIANANLIIKHLFTPWN